jgi:zinc transport system ATP-binding protein
MNNLMIQTILTVRDLNVKFDNHLILGHLSFDITRDSIVAILGPNGAGKSVLFKSLLGIIPYNGIITWADDVKIGYVPQKLSISNDLPITVLEFLKLKENDSKRIIETLTLVGFKQKAEHLHHDMRVLNSRLGSLSGGELQRILIAYSLLGDPNVLLLDEPTAGVDIEGEETFYNLFERLKKDKDLTILFISHDAQVVERYADKRIELIHEHRHSFEHQYDHKH